MSSPPRDNAALAHAAQTLIKKINANTLLVKNLQNICHVNGLSRSGVKADLQRRIIKKINDIVSQDDWRSFQEIERSVNASGGYTNYAPAQPTVSSQYYTASPSSNAPHTPLSAPFSYQPPAYMPNSHPYSMPNGAVNGHRPLTQSQHAGPSFKDSPFYRIVKLIGDIKVCDVMSQHRNSISISLRLSDRPELAQCVNDPTMRVMVFCAADRIGMQDIAFPHQAEIKVNGGEIKANLRGLKNKPGSTRPVDITDALRLKTQYTNNVDFTYALTQKACRHPNSKSEAEKFYLGIYLCKTTTVKVLAEKIAGGQRIRKETVISELTRKAQDPDVVATSQVLSLKCPLSYMRLALPCRGLSCAHIQCFDATSYLQLQEQGPQWLCPICNKSAPYSQLAVDEYVRDILQHTSSTTEQVTIEPDGRWHTQGAQKEAKADTPDLSFLHDDDGVPASADVSIVGAWGTATPNRSTNSIGTPLTAFSRESSSMPPRSATSNKRPAAEVIDLTLSDDDDEPIHLPPAKRQNMRLDHSFTFG